MNNVLSFKHVIFISDMNMPRNNTSWTDQIQNCLERVFDYLYLIGVGIFLILCFQLMVVMLMKIHQENCNWCIKNANYMYQMVYETFENQSQNHGACYGPLNISVS